MRPKALIAAVTTAFIAMGACGLSESAAADPLSTAPPTWGSEAGAIYVTLSPESTATGERLLNFDLVVNGQIVQRLQAISGKAERQYFRRGLESRSGSHEPLPQGVYRIGAVDRAPGLSQAIGDTFIPITPQFSTQRRLLGIHRDADRAIGGAGTEGCLGLFTQQDIDTVANFVMTYRVKTLVVNYGLAAEDMSSF